MTPEQQAAYIISQSACMLAEMEAMKATNAMPFAGTQTILYSPADFEALPTKYGVHHNAVVGWFTGR
jgi:hypothetical protein